MSKWKRESPSSWSNGNGFIRAVRYQGQYVYVAWVRDPEAETHPKGWRLVGAFDNAEDARNSCKAESA